MIAEVPRVTNPEVCFTVGEVLRLIEADVFGTERVQLINGRVYRDRRQSEAHVAAVSAGNVLLVGLFGRTDTVSVRCTLRLDDHNAPDPDFLVWPVPLRTPPADRPPPILVVEVSDRRTYREDAGLKLRMYARFGIVDYWIENLEADRVEVHRNPTNDTGRRSGWRYATVAHQVHGESIALLARPEVVAAVDDLLP